MITRFFYLSMAICACLLFFPPVVSAVELGEGIVLDPLTGDYTVTYLVGLDDGSKLLQKTRFEPATKIISSVQSKFHLGETGTVAYRYSVSSSTQSRQILSTFRFDPVANVIGSQDLPTNRATVTEAQLSAVFDANRAALATPSGWSGAIFPGRSGGFRISWNPVDPKAGIQPGSSLKGFGFSSQALPGLGTVELQGRRKWRTTYAGDGPQGDISQQFDALRLKDFVTRPAAIPTIAVPDPFDPAVTLERIQAHMHTWIAMQLLDPAFSSQLDRSFQSAISAYRLNQPKVGKQQLEAMRVLIKKEHADADKEDDQDDRGEKGEDDDKARNKRVLINKLAARVLDFDLKYVTKRMGGDKDD